MSGLRRAPTEFLAPALAAALLAAATPACAQDACGAIASGSSAGGENAAYGFAWNHATPDEAQAAALKACSAADGADCALLARFENGCGALAMDRYGRARRAALAMDDQGSMRLRVAAGEAARRSARAACRHIPPTGTGCNRRFVFTIM